MLRIAQTPRHGKRRLRKRLLGFMGAVAVMLLFVPGIASAADPVIAGAGDISCGTSNSSYNGGLGNATACRQKYTSDLLVAGGYAAVFTLGDNINDSGSLSNFQQAYDPTWGRVKAITHPNLGNHEGTSASGYCTYFGAAAHCNSNGTQAGAGFYSWDIGAWHVVVINSNCTAVGGCDVGSAQYAWLQRDLAAHPAACTLAYWHHPRFSSGHDGSNTFMQPIWKLFYDNGGDVVLSGHSHDYERFAPMDGTGSLNRSDGMRQFVVGTGGAFFTGFGSAAPNSEVRNNTTFGVLALTLHATSYDWRFVPEAGKTFTDAGSQSCRGPGGGATDSQPPSPPTALGATASSGLASLSWTAADDNVGVVGYDILRGPAGGALAKVGESTGTTFADTTVIAGQSYDYQVVARDAAGNVSQPSNKVTVTVPSGGGTSTLSFTPVADASVKQASPTSNFGTSTSLNSDGGSGVAMESYLRFTVSGVGSAGVNSARLRVYVPSDGTTDGPAIYACVDATCSTWSETAITWNTRPARSSTATTDTGRIAGGSFVEYDVTPLIHGDGTYTLVIGPTPTTDGVVFSSRQTTTNKPQLLVATGGGATDSQPPSPPTALGATASSGLASLSWTAADDNVGVVGYDILRGPAGGALAKVGESTGTTFADTTVIAGQSYDYQVVARDAAGNVSQPSGKVTVTVPSGGGTSTLSFTPVADASVKQASPTSNFGTSTSLNSDSGSGVAMESYLRFTVSGVGSAGVSSAKLRVYVPSDGTADGPGVYACVDATCSNWSETAITWNTRPARSSTATADTGRIAGGSFVEYDVTPLIRGDGTYTLVIGPTPTTDGVVFSSRQATTNKPQLLVGTG